MICVQSLLRAARSIGCYAPVSNEFLPDLKTQVWNKGTIFCLLSVNQQEIKLLTQIKNYFLFSFLATIIYVIVCEGGIWGLGWRPCHAPHHALPLE